MTAFITAAREAIRIADAHRDNGKRFVVRADEKLTAFIELESAVRASRELAWQVDRIFSNYASLNGSESGGGFFPAGFFASSGPRNPTINLAGKRKEEPHECTDSA